MLCLAVWSLRYTRHFFGPSSYSLGTAVGHRAPPNKKKTIFVSLSCGGPSSGFSCCFHGKYHYYSIYIYYLKLAEAVLFSGLRSISLQIPIVGRVWNEGSRMSKATITIDYYKAFGVTKSPSLGLPAFMRPSPIWRVLNKLRCERLPSI